ncbi:MAG: glycosyltransferase [Odoribacter splanchnicus]
MSSFSVLMSVYYKEQALYLKEALDSIWINQILKPDQIVLVEDGPLTPELYEVIDEFQKEVGDVLTLVKNETNQGLAKALNKGIGFIRTDLIARMDSDDISDKKRFVYEIGYMDKHPDVMILGGSIQEMDENRNFLNQRHYPKTCEEIRKYVWKGSPVAHPTVVMRKSIFQNISYNEKVGQNEDIALWFEALKRNVKMENIEDIIYYFRMSSGCYKRRSRKKAWKEFTIYVQGLWRLYGLSFKYVYPMARLIFRMCPNILVKYFYNSEVRTRLLG